ncbi:ciliary microtubule-associated protein 3 [Nyctibius grandis]|uniref:ciliary microtubule-associated protein 3 n=1 Tax=Nyctibius grandis TaxID=48427 RepID=UPI0035BC476E
MAAECEQRESSRHLRRKKSSKRSSPLLIFLSPDVTDVQKQISFGSRQERNIFPFHHAPDRLGIQLIAIRGDPSLGPGCYLSQERSSLIYSQENKPLSTKGYVIGARTARRFRPEPQTETPGPGTHQSLWKNERKCQPAYAPFSIKTPRFPDKPSDKEFFPGPGTYKVDKQLHKKVTWPMKFGSPDWSAVPMPAQRFLKMEVQKLTIDKEFRKHRNRLAYLSLYYS